MLRRIESNGITLLTYDLGGSVTFTNSVVTETSLTSSSNDWPSIMTPHWFSKKYTVDGIPEITLFVRESSWSGHDFLNVGVKYSGDYTQTSGLCYETPGEEPEPPITCDALKTCCDSFSQVHAIFETCLADGSAACCPGDDSNMFVFETEKM